MLLRYLEHEFERNFAHQNKYSLGALLEKLSPIVTSQAQTVMIRSNVRCSHVQRTAG